MAGRRHDRWLLFVVMTTTTAACNVLSGGHDRVLEDLDSATTVKPFAETGSNVDPDAGVEQPDTSTPDSALPDGAEAGPLQIPVSMAVSSPNAAGYSTSPAGVTITIKGSVDHAVLVPAPPPAIPSGDFTIYATIKAGTIDGEWGILTRMQANGATGGYGLGCKFGPTHLPFLGAFAPPDWNPSKEAEAAAADAWTFVANAHYKFVLKVVGLMAYGKVWDPAKGAEPALFQVSHTQAIGVTQTGIGYYNYIPTGGIGATLEEWHVTVP